MFVCLSVRYAFGHRTSKCNQTFQGTPPGSEEGQDRIGATERGVGTVSPPVFEKPEKFF